MSETERLKTLYNLEIMDSHNETEFDDIVQIAAAITNAPISLVTLLDEHRQWFKAKVGMDADETAREHAFCNVGIDTDTDFFEVKDATEDDRFNANPYVTGSPNIRYYGGVPLVYNKQKLGMLCVINPPHFLSEQQITSLKHLRDHVVRLFDLRLKNKILLLNHAHLEEREQVLKKMMGIISHDVRTPFINVAQVLNAIEEAELDIENLKTFAPQLQETVASGLKLVDDLVGWSKKMVTESESTERRIKVKEIINRVAGQLFENIAAKGNRLQLEAGEEELVTDTEGLAFILRNLAGNANKFTDKGVIVIRSSHDDNLIYIEVEDNGRGIATADLEKIKSRNVVASRDGTAREKGTGFGLLLVHDYVDMLKGKLAIESEPGKGSKFIIALPYSENE